jgi:predicted outer membrane repeat protein
VHGKISIKNATFSNNIASGSGGAIFTDNYEDLTINSTTKFSGNKAAKPYLLQASDTKNWTIYHKNIDAKSWSVPASGYAPFSNGYNNYDINYTIGAEYKVPAATPKITTQPKAESIYYQKQRPSALKVKATSPDSGKLTYQWYYNTKATKTKAKAIKGATKATYTPSTKSARIYYYFCKVTNTKVGTSPAAKATYSKIVVVRTAPYLHKKTVNISPYYTKALNFDILSASKKSKAKAVISKDKNLKSQKFVFYLDKSGYYKIKNANSGLYLTVNGGKAKYSYIVQTKSSSSKAQKFRLVPYGTNNFVIVSALSSSYVLDIKGSSSKSGSAVVLYKYKAGDKSQRFAVTTARR